MKRRSLTSTFTVHYITVLYENTPLGLTSVGKTPITLLVQEQHIHHAITQQQIQSFSSYQLLTPQRTCDISFGTCDI